MIGSYPPALTLVLGALLVPLLPGRLKKAVILLLPAISFMHLLGLDHGESWRITLFDYRLTLVRIDELSLLFGYLFHIAVWLGLLFSINVRGSLHHVAALVYAGAALGAVFAGDLITLFVWWELLSFPRCF